MMMREGGDKRKDRYGDEGDEIMDLLHANVKVFLHHVVNLL